MRRCAAAQHSCHGVGARLAPHGLRRKRDRAPARVEKIMADCAARRRRTMKFGARCAVRGARAARERRTDAGGGSQAANSRPRRCLSLPHVRGAEVLIAPVHSRDGVSAATDAVLALVAAGSMQEHYAGAAARAISEPQRCSSAWSAVISEKSETRKVLRLEATDPTQ